MAKGASYRLTPEPNSKDCAGGDARKKLTDGLYASKNGRASSADIWTSDATAGWSHVFAPTITIDLGADQPISGFSFSTAAGRAQVAWPEHIFVHTSVDGTSWFNAGDLVQLSEEKPPAQGVYRYAVRNLQLHARYVRFIAVATPYIFCDEIEIYRGSKSAYEVTNVGELTNYDGAAWAAEQVEKLRPIKRIEKDLAFVKDAVAANGQKINSVQAAEMNKVLDRLAKEMPPFGDFDPTTFKAIMPLNAAHAEILSVYGQVLNAKGIAPLAISKSHRYDPLAYGGGPSLATDKAALSVNMMGEEKRSDSLLITNASGVSKSLDIRFEGLPENAKDWLRLSYSPWTDTAEGTPVADALVSVEPHESLYQVPLPAGLTTPIWVTVDSAHLAAGKYEGQMVVSSGEQVQRIPIDVRVSPIQLAKPRLSLGMWDESNGRGGRGITEKNRPSAIELMKSSYVDTPIASPSVMQQVSAEDFNEDGTLKAAPDYAELDAWVALWEGARYYGIFLNVDDKFAGSAIDSPDFRKKVISWALALADHAKSLGLKPSQLMLSPVDEPKTEEQDRLVEAWSSAIKASGTGLTVMTNPIWDRPQETKNQKAITEADIVCPNLRIFTEGGASVAEYFAERRKGGQALWFYLCEGPVRHFDPHSYYRLQAWKAFQHDATGIAFWAFGDLGGARSSWNEYSPQRSLSYAPAFLGEDSTTDSIHWNAVKEGVQDYEYLAMLREALPKANASQQREGQKLLNDSVQAVLKGYSTDYSWTKPADRSVPDRVRSQIISFLEKVQGSKPTITRAGVN